MLSMLYEIMFLFYTLLFLYIFMLIFSHFTIGNDGMRSSKMSSYIQMKATEQFFMWYCLYDAVQDGSNLQVCR